MNPTPLVSIGLFVYNGERFIDETVQSLLCQTFTDFELIISDNASTDRTGEIAQGYAQRDPRIRYYRSAKNMGAGWNVRRIYELATGKYFKQAAADDLLEPEFLARCVAALEHDPGCVLAYAATKEIDENGAFLKHYVTPVKVNSDDPVARFGEMLLVPSWCYQIFGVMRMATLRQIPAQGSYVNGDGVLLARLALLGKFYEVPEPLFINRHHKGQSTRTLPARVQHRRFRLSRRHPRLPAPEWWDPSKVRKLTFPEFRLLLEYFWSIYRSPLTSSQKLRCYLMLLPWIRMHFKHMLKDLLIAGDQILYSLQERSPHAGDARQSASSRAMTVAKSSDAPVSEDGGALTADPHAVHHAKPII
jgi:glycosyltransferase involved in cell wall biosynthesis